MAEVLIGLFFTFLINSVHYLIAVKLMKPIYCAMVVLCLSAMSTAARAQSPVLDAYVQTGIAGNNGLKQQQFLLDKSLYALEEAKGLFLPTVSFGGTYTLAAGGRTQSLPIGDLLNPVYATLNQMTQSKAFPQVENQEIQFLPNNFYDARFRTTQSVYNAEIQYNKRIKGEQISLQKIEIRLYKRELAKNIKQAYFQYAQAVEAEQIYGNALGLMQESKRVSESLVKNGAGNPSAVIKVEGELAGLNAKRIEAQNNRNNAAAYFNFLLNRPFDAAISLDTALLESVKTAPAVADSAAVQNREELAKLRTATTLNGLVLDMNKSYHLPKVGVQVDLGSQAFNFKWGGYVLAGLSLDVPLWAGNRNENKIRETQAELNALQAQTAQVEDQLQLQAQMAANSYRAALDIFQNQTPQVAAAQRYYRDVLRRYKEGQANYIELLDARTDLTTAELQLSLAKTAIWLRWVELERALASAEL